MCPRHSEGSYRECKLILDVMKSESGFSASGIQISGCPLFYDINSHVMTVPGGSICNTLYKGYVFKVTLFLPIARILEIPTRLIRKG